jgi:hypothetical protein
MTDDRSLERAARSWIEEGPTQAPDHAMQAALSRIDTTRQERDLWIPWRLPTMSDTTRLAITAATIVVVAVGGLYVAGLIGPGGSGGPGPTATPIPTPSSAQPIALGTVTLEDDGCTWDGNPGSLEASPNPLRGTLDALNETDTFANFGIFRLDKGSYEEAEAWILREDDALHGGPSQPPQDFATEVATIDAPDGREYAANLALAPGTYGIVCSSNEPPPGLVFAVYLAGPLEVTAP